MKSKLTYMAALLLAAGCSDIETYDDGTTGLVPIRLTSGIEVQTRAHTGLDTQYPAGRGVAFWVDNADASAQLYGNNLLTTDGRGGFTGGAPMYFPRTDDRVDIYALHTNGALDEAFPATVTHTVAADQRAEAGYYDSDLLYTINRGVAKTTDGIPLTFYHLLSKVRIALVPETAETDLAGAQVQLLGTQLTADFTPSKTADVTVREERAAMVAAGGSAGNITLSNEPSADFTAASVRYNDAVVVPQTVAGGAPFIRVTFSDGEALEWSPDAALTFESGKRYTYHVTVSRTGLKVTASVSGWEDELPEYLDRMEKIAELGISLTKIPAGEFQMGQAGIAEPVHTVKLSKGFYMSRYEITNFQFAAFLNDVGIGSDGEGSVTYHKDSFTQTVTETQTLISQPRPPSTAFGGVYWEGETGKWVPVNHPAYDDIIIENDPVIYVSWYGAKAFADWIGGALPTEAQWEYACRAGTTTNFSYGDEPNFDYMWSLGNFTYTTQIVGTKKPNPWRLYDMHGNAMEWCSDWLGDYESGDVTDPVGPAAGEYRVLRGGATRLNVKYCRSADRSARLPLWQAYEHAGFRVVFPLE